MDIEELTKSQIVLLTLLVSFVTSIATGIVTVALVEQAPTDVTRVIQKTVERTVETVKPEIKTKVVTQEKRVIVRESDLVASAVKNNIPSLVKIYRKGLDGDVFLGLGVVVSGQGTIVTDSSFINKDTVYKVFASGENYDAKVLSIGGERGVALLSIINSQQIPRPAGIFDGAVPLGKTTILLSGEDNISISTGVVTNLSIGVFTANVDSAMILPGSVLISSDGNLLGISTAKSRAECENCFVSARSILAVVTAPVFEEENEEIDESAATSTDEQSDTAEDDNLAEDANSQQASAASALSDDDSTATSTQGDE